MLVLSPSTKPNENVQWIAHFSVGLNSGISSNSIVTSWSKGDKPDPDSRKVSVHTMSHTERKVNLINKFTIAHFTINLKKKPFSLHGMLGCIVSFSRWLDTPISS